jgi:hypothetical protein
MAMRRALSAVRVTSIHQTRFKSSVHNNVRIERLLRANDLSPSALDLEEIDLDLYVAPQVAQSIFCVFDAHFMLHLCIKMLNSP